MKTGTYSGFLALGVVGGALILGPSLRPRDVGQSTAEPPTAPQAASPADYIGLDGHAEPLRGSFNADLGKVRILMLVAPT
jgi:hypothetical protein